MLADCELTSNCSVNSKRAQMYYGQQYSERRYDNLRLESVRASTTAEKKKPLLITRPRTLVNRQNFESNTIFQDESFVKLRYEVRRKFFEDLACQKDLTTESVTSETKVMNGNNGKDISLQNSIINPNEKLHTQSVKGYNADLTNASTKEYDETRFNDIVVHSVKREKIVQPNFVKLVDIKEASSSTNSNSKVEEKLKPFEEAKYRIPTIEKIAPVKPEFSIARKRDNKKLDNDSIESMINTNKEQQQCITSTSEATLTRSCAVTFQCENSDNEKNSQLLNDLSPDNDERRSINRYECEDKEASSSKEINGNATELKLQSVRSWIESSMCESNWPTSEADTYESYCDNITKIVESIDMNIVSSRTELDALPDTDTCVKYNLDSTNMSLIYSLTPPAVVDQEETDNDDTSRDLTERSLEWQSDSTRNDNDDVLSDYIWIELATKTQHAKTTQCPQNREMFSDNSCELEQPVTDRHSASGSDRHSMSDSDRHLTNDSDRHSATDSDRHSASDSDRHSVSGSDILELPSSTILELKDIDSESFHNGINESANEIIADLNASDEAPPLYDALQTAQHIIAEIIESIYVLVYLDSSIYDLGVARGIVLDLINSYHHEYLLIESADRAHVSTTDNDNICRIKGFLGDLSSDFIGHDIQKGIRKKEEQEPSAVIEFCTVAKRLPMVATDYDSLQLNFRVVEVSTDEYVDNTSSNTCQLLNKSFIDDDRDTETKIKSRHNENIVVTKTKMQPWPHDRCFCCREREDSIKDKPSLTPISEESDELLEEIVDSTTSGLENPNYESSRYPEIYLINNVEDSENTMNSVRKSNFLDDTYTISEVSSDNDETKELQEQCDV